MTKLSWEDKEFLRNTIFTTRPEKPCEDCGGFHLRACPRVRRVKLIGQGAGTGNRIEVEFWEKWDDSEVIYPEDVWEEEDYDRDAPGPVRDGSERGPGSDGEVGV